ncbi:MAG: serine--tRNA ligase [Candidatus Pacebacteria bacterium]|jgi:seryl-tRNA synthetase|nr:serine--tRNA ligase [Candidatus Paceibacterota bacterium]
MLDIKFIRENRELVKEGARKKHLTFDVDALIDIDTKRLELLSLVESLRAEQNVISDKVVTATPEDRAKMIEDMKGFKEHLKEKEDELRDLMKLWQDLMIRVPNIPDMTVPEGVSDAENKEVKVWGEKPTFTFAPKDHISLMESLDMADFERGTKVSGFRGYFLKNDGARLSMAIWQYALEFFTARGLAPMIVPSLVTRETLFGTGYLPEGEDDLYKTQDGEYFAGTGEVATMAYYSGEVIDGLPKKILAFSPCFRREAGSHSKDVKGLIRVHEFFKLEQVVLCEANHEQSVQLHEEINGNTEAFIESLGIPYHTVVNCGGDLGLGQVKKYDIELWVPKENTYREISSASYFHDFQTRRLNIRYKDRDGKLRYAHSLNCTAIPTPRILVSLVENFQQADGTIRVPEVLKKYIGKDVLGVATAQ